ncbi:MAG: PilZ domain-containing protein [Thermodesulfobacteriota bacterium]|nr:PilZ domain-containing protein [Thermodesulfobacteriota bacterium]
MEVQKVYVNPDNTAVIKCPHCDATKVVHVGKFKGSKRRLKIRCTCNASLAVTFEFRKAYRKETNLQGFYAKVRPSQAPSKIQVKDLSMTGLRFVTASPHTLRKGDELIVKFTLDDRSRSKIEKKVVVRWIKDREIGCCFSESVQYDKVFGFYLMS